MSIGLSLSNPIISLEIFNYENKSKPSRSNKLSCFKYFSFKEDSHVFFIIYLFVFIFINLSIAPFL